MESLLLIQKKEMTNEELNEYECNVQGSCYWECYCNTTGCDDDMCSCR